MEMQLDVLSFVPILSAADPALRQFLVFGGAFLLLAIPVIVLKVTSCPVAIATGDFDRLEIFDHYGPFDDFGPYICLALLVICGGLSGGLISYELVRSYAFSPLWYYVLPAVSGASVYFQYISYRYPVFIKALSDDDFDVRRHAAEALGKLGDKRAVDPLINALSDDDFWVRLSAAEALGRLGDTRAVDPLIKMLSDDYSGVRRDAAEALGLLADKRAVDPLIEALADNDSHVRREAAEALGRLGDKRAVDPLIEALADDDSGGRRSAAEALEQLGQPEWAQHVRGDDDDFIRLGSSKNSKAVVPLIKALASDGYDVREAAAEALGRLGDKRAVDPLIEALADWDDDVRKNATEALGLLGDKRVSDPLIKDLADHDSDVRQVTAKALEQLGQPEWVRYVRGDDNDFHRLGSSKDPRAAVPLIKALGNGNSDSRKTAAKALEQLGQPEWAQYVRGDDDDFRRLGSSKDPRAVDPLIKALAEPDYIYDIRQAVAKALGHLGDKRAIDPLIKALADNDSMVRKVAAEALEQLGQPEWAQYVRGDDDDFHRLGSSKDPKAVDPLIKALADWHDDVRKNAVKALGLLGDKRAIDPLIKVLADDNSIVRDAADEALKKLGYKK